MQMVQLVLILNSVVSTIPESFDVMGNISSSGNLCLILHQSIIFFFQIMDRLVHLTSFTIQFGYLEWMHCCLIQIAQPFYKPSKFFVCSYDIQDTDATDASGDTVH